MNTKSCPSKEFCTCPVEKCPRHPKNHDQGCTPCIHDNLKRGKMPACFFHHVHEDMNEVRDFTIAGFVDYYTKHQAPNAKKKPSESK